MTDASLSKPKINIDLTRSSYDQNMQTSHKEKKVISKLPGFVDAVNLDAKRFGRGENDGRGFI